MKIISSHNIFRNFSANDWKQSESMSLPIPILTCNDSELSTFSSNAEKMRKNIFSEDQIALTSSSQNH